MPYLCMVSALLTAVACTLINISPLGLLATGRMTSPTLRTEGGRIPLGNYSPVFTIAFITIFEFILKKFL